ncbi:6-phospho-3-hexuloisomerase [Gottfriedia solisilvae]|uniref:3-hexulose-6-phosphate isomerase n=1 Tax=Gottfriedia solisilvae TaxID=1516104 RepID=A0A8J3APR1_9BACI|nr:6-phospho-3-hexuloisomerase [Gottfriedia solisilvae]GGI17843.1 3-hexulose-6-phosphate isomerase [Gottfriedia solisilvae]
MQTTQYLTEIIKEINLATDQIPDDAAEKLVDAIVQSNKIFVAGAGRSGFMVKSFAMRMMHMNLDSYVVGETITPNLEKGDMLIIGSGSGETKSLISIAQKAKSLGGVVVLVSIFPESSIGKLADITITLPGSPKDKSKNHYQTIQPMGSLFEQTLLLLLDAVILRYMEKMGLDSQTMYGKHANLE